MRLTIPWPLISSLFSRFIIHRLQALSITYKGGIGARMKIIQSGCELVRSECLVSLRKYKVALCMWGAGDKNTLFGRDTVQGDIPVLGVEIIDLLTAMGQS